MPISFNSLSQKEMANLGWLRFARDSLVTKRTPSSALAHRNAVLQDVPRYVTPASIEAFHLSAANHIKRMEEKSNA